MCSGYKIFFFFNINDLDFIDLDIKTEVYLSYIKGKLTSSVKEFLKLSLLAFAVSLIITAVLGPIFIPWLRKLKFGQEIREEGPAWHQKKSGTPTMGGIMFIIGIAVSVAVTGVIFALNGNFDVKFARCILLFDLE